MQLLLLVVPKVCILLLYHFIPQLKVLNEISKIKCILVYIYSTSKHAALKLTVITENLLVGVHRLLE